MDVLPLCYRCEHRAVFMETGAKPRYECGEHKAAVMSCYMFSPVKPLCMRKDDGEKRPAFGPHMVAARMHTTGVAKVELHLTKQADDLVAYWIPLPEAVTAKPPRKKKRIGTRSNKKE